MPRRYRAAFAALAVSLVCAAPAAAGVPSNADWHEFYIKDALPYPAGQPSLHADLLVPKGTDLSKDKLPIIVSVGPYFAHAGSTTPTTLTNDGPQLRWNDLIQDGELFERGYGLLQVDLRGFGGSQGCNDFGGTGEQTDVKRAVEWAAKQPWALGGEVAIFGKSYDAWTGVMALDEKPKGLGAAIIESPIIDGYRTLYQDGVHYDVGWYLTPGLYQEIDAIPPAVPDITNGRVEYVAGYATGSNPACYATNIALQDGLQKRDDALGFWAARDLPNARGSDVPTLWSHGFLDVNTKPDNFESVFSSLTGPKRAWFGQFAHTRPNEAGVGRNEFWFDEMFAFLDEHLRGEKAAKLPTVEVEDSEGRWRAEEQWPPADGVDRAIALRAGSYADQPRSSSGFWSITAPLDHDAWIAGVPHAEVELTTQLPDATVIASVWDVAEDGSALMITRGAGKYQSTGAGTKSVELYPADYIVRKGRRIGVLLSASDSNYLPTPSMQTVTVTGGSLSAPFLTFDRRKFLEGDPSNDAGQRKRTTVPAAALAAAPTTWDTAPPELEPGKPSAKRSRVARAKRLKAAKARQRLARRSALRR